MGRAAGNQFREQLPRRRRANYAVVAVPSCDKESWDLWHRADDGDAIWQRRTVTHPHAPVRPRHRRKEATRVIAEDVSASLIRRSICIGQFDGSRQPHRVFHRCKAETTTAMHDRHRKLDRTAADIQVITPFRLERKANTER